MAPFIKAVLAAPTTTYTIVNMSDRGGGVFAWAGTDCGSVSGANTDTLVWNHNCNHVGVAHPTTTITVRFTTIGAVELRCTYTSARTGSGPPCEPVN